MLLNRANLDAAFTGFSTSFNAGFAAAPHAWSQVATKMPSHTSENQYGWLGQFASMREWLGPREIKSIMAHSYAVENKLFEQSISISRNDFEDDRYSLMGSVFDELGRSAADKPEELVFGLLNAGFLTECYDGQFFFDTDHPVSNGVTTTTVSNSGGGSGAPWFLLDTSRAIRPLLFQERRALGALVRKDKAEDDNVFLNNEYVYGSDGRCNAGYGLWQMAYGSKQTLDATNYAAARAAMKGLKGEGGRPLNISPTVLVCGTASEEAALKLLNSEFVSGGDSNPWKGTAKLIVSPWIG